MLKPLALALALSAAALSAAAPAQAESAALKRIKDAGVINLGYRDNAAPFSFRGTDGKPAGYSIDLCSRIANAIMSELKMKSLKVNWVPLTSQTRLKAVAEGKVDMECGMTTVTMGRQKEVDFSNLIFVDGGNVLLREDTTLRRTADLAGRKIAVQGGTTTEQVLRRALKLHAQLSVFENSPSPHNDFVIYGSKGRITGRGLTRSRAGGQMQVMTTDGKTRSTEFPETNAHAASVAAFSAALLEGRDPVPSGIDGLRSVQLTDAMAKSAWDGVHVRLAY